MIHDDRTAHPQKTVGRGHFGRRTFLTLAGGAALGIGDALIGLERSAAAPSSGVTISALIDSQDEQWYKQRTPLFTQATGINVDLQTVPEDDYITKLQTNIAGDTSTDVFLASTAAGTYYVLANDGAALDLSPFIKKDNYDLHQFFSASVKNLAGPFGGKMYGLPYSGHPSGVLLVYNIDILTADKIAQPTWQFTTSDLLAWAKSVTRGDVWGFYPPVHLWRDLVPMALTFGASLLSPDLTTAQLNTPEAMRFWSWLYDIFQVSKVSPRPKDLPTGGMRQLYVAQKLVSMSDSVGYRSIEPQVKFKWGVVPFPKGPTGVRAAHVQSNAIMIWAKTKHPDEAWQWAKWMVSKDSAVALGKLSAGPGERPDAWSDPAFAADPLQKVAGEMMSVGHSVMNPANFRTSEMQTLVIASLNTVWNGDTKFEKAFFDSLNGKVQAILNKPKP